MYVPTNKPPKHANPEHDHHITQARFDKITLDLKKLKEKLEYAQSEVGRLAQMGDFSENMAYSMAKGRLRWLNRRILEIESQIQLAEIIKPSSKPQKIEIGHQVTIEVNSNQKIYLILGPVESDPENDVISYKSPIGSALIGHKVGDKINIKIADKEVTYALTNIK